MEEMPADRLKKIRKAKGFKTADEAIERFGWKAHTYKAHEGGARGITPEQAKKYAAAFGSTPKYILFGDGDGAVQQPESGKVREKSPLQRARDLEAKIRDMCAELDEEAREKVDLDGLDRDLREILGRDGKKKEAPSLMHTGGRSQRTKGA